MSCNYGTNHCSCSLLSELIDAPTLRTHHTISVTLTGIRTRGLRSWLCQVRLSVNTTSTDNSTSTSLDTINELSSELGYKLSEASCKSNSSCKLSLSVTQMATVPLWRTLQSPSHQSTLALTKDTTPTPTLKKAYAYRGHTGTRRRPCPRDYGTVQQVPQRHKAPATKHVQHSPPGYAHWRAAAPQTTP